MNDSNSELKGTHMYPLTYDVLRDHPELLEAILRKARRERAEAVHRLFILPFKALFRRKPKTAPALRPSAAC